MLLQLNVALPQNSGWYVGNTPLHTGLVEKLFVEMLFLSPSSRNQCSHFFENNMSLLLVNFAFSISENQMPRMCSENFLNTWISMITSGKFFLQLHIKKSFRLRNDSFIKLKNLFIYLKTSWKPHEELLTAQSGALLKKHIHIQYAVCKEFSFSE